MENLINLLTHQDTTTLIFVYNIVLEELKKRGAQV